MVMIGKPPSSTFTIALTCTCPHPLLWQPYVLEAVRKAEKKILEAKLNHEYAGIQGNEEKPTTHIHTYIHTYIRNC